MSEDLNYTKQQQRLLDQIDRQSSVSPVLGKVITLGMLATPILFTLSCLARWQHLCSKYDLCFAMRFGEDIEVLSELSVYRIGFGVILVVGFLFMSLSVSILARISDHVIFKGILDLHSGKE